MLKVSIIIPAYNNGRFIGECIQSVLEQSFQDFEIIIVDDGSTDNTKSIVKKYTDPRISYIYQENRGACIARNNGILVSTGEYLVFLDSDDMIKKDAVKRGVEILSQHPEVGLHYGDAHLLDLSGNLHTDFPPKREPGIWPGIQEIKQFLDKGNNIGMGMVRRSAVMDAGLFNPDFTGGSNDYDLWVRIAKKMSVSYVHEPVITYRMHSGSITRRRTLTDYFRAHRRILASIFRDPVIGPQLMTLRNASYFQLHYSFAEYAYSRELHKLSRMHLKTAFSIYPHAILETSMLRGLILLLKMLIPINLLRKLRGTKKNVVNFILRDNSTIE